MDYFWFDRAGALAKFIMPGDDPGSFTITTLIGIGGASILLFAYRKIKS